MILAKLLKDARVNKEIERLREIFADLSPAELQAFEGLIVQAARLRVSLDDMWADIQEKGDVELFSQSDRTDPYERERPVARLFNARDKAYQTAIKMLVDRLPDQKTRESARDELRLFNAGG